MSYKIKNKHLDLLAAYNRSDEPSKALKSIKILIVPIVLVLVFATSFAFMTMITLNKKNQLQGVKDDIEVVQLKIDSTDKTPYDELHQMETTYTSLEALDQSLSSLPELTKEKIMYLKTDLISGVSIKTISFDQTKAQISLSMTSSNVQNIEKYITKLKKHSEYSSIDYNGYKENSSSQTTSSGNVDVDGNPIENVIVTTNYSFSLVINLDGKAGE